MSYHVERPVLPAFRYYGGKAGLSRQILDRAPEHSVFVEPFAGALNVLLNKYRSDIEVACDLHPEIINFYGVLVDRCEDLNERLQAIPLSKGSFLAALAAGYAGDELTRALNFLVRQHGSFSGMGTSWVDGGARDGRWETLPFDLRIVSARLKGVRILLCSAFEVICEYDSPDTLFYVDPPYYEQTRVTGKAYLHEFTAMDHLRLLKLLNTLRGSVLLSGYAHPTYEKELAGWSRVEFETTAISGMRRNGAARSPRTEILWVKPLH